MGGDIRLGRQSTCIKVGWECTFVTPFPPLRRTQVPCVKKKPLKITLSGLPPRFPSNTHRPHMPLHFIAGLYFFKRAGARIPLVVPSLTPCARPCESCHYPCTQTLPPRSVPILPPHHPYYPPFPRQISYLSCVCVFTPPPPLQDLPPRQASCVPPNSSLILPTPGVP